MKPNSAVSAADLNLEHAPVSVAQFVDGEPTTGAMALTGFEGLELGVWEMTPGVMSDVEADELFVVLSGSGTVEFVDGSPTLRLSAGDVVRLAAGAQTIWTVSETLRKVYVTRG